MILDNFDLWSLIEIHLGALEKRKVGVGHLAKGWFKEEYRDKDLNKDYARKFSRKYVFVGKRMRVLEKEGLLIFSLDLKDRNKRKYFKINYGKVELKKTRFPDNKLKSLVCFKMESNKWIFFEV